MVKAWKFNPAQLTGDVEEPEDLQGYPNPITDGIADAIEELRQSERRPFVLFIQSITMRVMKEYTDNLVIGWMLSTLFLALGIVAMGTIAMLTLNPLVIGLTVVLMLVFWLPTVLLILISVRQNSKFTASLRGDT